MGRCISVSNLALSLSLTLTKDMRRLCTDELKAIVGRVVSGRGKPLDTVLTHAIFGNDVPSTWGDWPKEAVAMWKEGCDLYATARHEYKLTFRNDGSVITLEHSWEVVLDLSVDLDEWWCLSGVTWADVGEKFKLTPRRAAYRMSTLGWRMTGSGMSVPNRKVVVAPCVVCGTVCRAVDIWNRLGPECTKGE